MSKILRFPETKNYATRISKFKHFLPAIEEIEARAIYLSIEYAKDYKSLKQIDVTNFIIEIYKTTIDIIERKRKNLFYITPAEENIYSLCTEVIKEEKNNPFEGQCDYLFAALIKARDCIFSLKVWFELLSAHDIINQELIDLGLKLIPDLLEITKGGYQKLEDFYQIDVPNNSNLSNSQLECSLKYQKKLPFDLEEANLMLDLSMIDFDNIAPDYFNFVKLDKQELPKNLALIFRKGIINCSQGLRAWVGKRDGVYVVVFSGSKISIDKYNYYNMVTKLFLKAAAIVKIVAQLATKVYVVGHSLGGLYAQIASISNVIKYRIECFCFNSPGLVKEVLDLFSYEKLVRAKSHIRLFRCMDDRLSIYGGKIGSLYTLPSATIKEGLYKYKIEFEKEIKPLKLSRINFKYHIDYDFIPYTQIISAVVNCDISFPIFCSDLESNNVNFFEIEIKDYLLENLDLKNNVGVIDKYNGTCQTVYNRLLLFAYKQPIVNEKSIGNIQSSIFFGKFGLDLDDFIEMVHKVYNITDEIYINPTGLDFILAHLNNTFEYEKAAMIKGIQMLLAFNIETEYFTSKENENKFDKFIINFSGKRKELFNNLKKEDSSLESKKLALIKGISYLLESEFSTVLYDACLKGIFSHSDYNNYLDIINSFCLRIISKY